MSLSSNASFWFLLSNTIQPNANMIYVVLFTVFICSVAPLFFRRNVTDKHGHSIPPGPLLRHAFLGKYPERALYAWAQTYGGLYSLWIGEQLFMIISDATIAKDLLVNNGAVFSGRRSYFLKNRTILKGRAITASGYDDPWRQHRRIATSLLTPKAIEGYARVLDYEAHILIKSLYCASNAGVLAINPAHFCGRFALNNMLTVSFATRTDSTEDPLTERALALATEFMDLTGPFSNAVDFITLLEYVPTSKRERGRALSRGIVDVYGAMIERVQKRMARGEDVPDCLVKTLLLIQEKEKLDWEDLCMLAAVFTLGGVHSTAGLIQWFLALIAMHPEIQARAHAELETVIGQEAWPCAEDEKLLPYIRAIIKECGRIHSPFFLATPHYSTADFVYRDMYIPKGTALILNAYTIHQNKERYLEPSSFTPERYLGDELTSAESAKQADPLARDHWMFGAGRRICPGMHVAERELFLAISRLLWAFEIKPADGKPISLVEYEGESGRTPLPYRIVLRPRHEKVSTMVNRTEEIALLNLHA